MLLRLHPLPYEVYVAQRLAQNGGSVRSIVRLKAVRSASAVVLEAMSISRSPWLSLRVLNEEREVSDVSLEAPSTPRLILASSGCTWRELVISQFCAGLYDFARMTAGVLRGEGYRSFSTGARWLCEL